MVYSSYVQALSSHQRIPAVTSTKKPAKKSNRRRQIDPTTCERDYSRDEIEFMNALNEYKRTSGRMFPTCSEILEVVQKLGYAKQSLPTNPLAESTMVHQAHTTTPVPLAQTVAAFCEPLMV
jgi:hypothetical protein